MTRPSSKSSPSATPMLRLSALPRNVSHEVLLVPEADLMHDLRDRLDLLALRKVRLDGTLTPDGKRDWVLRARLGATVVQPCISTTDPVTTRIDEAVLRQYKEAFRAPEDAEAEMPDDDTIEALPDHLDLSEVLFEALSLALPPFPRARDAEPTDVTSAPPGAAPIEDAKENPFAALEGLKKQLDP